NTWPDSCRSNRRSSTCESWRRRTGSGTSPRGYSGMLSLEVNIARPRKSLSFVMSVGLHATVLTWVAVGPPLPGSELSRRSLYEQEIKPNEKKIIWYAVNEK